MRVMMVCTSCFLGTTKGDSHVWVTMRGASNREK
jgi:hypothetical protein